MFPSLNGICKINSTKQIWHWFLIYKSGSNKNRANDMAMITKIGSECGMTLKMNNFFAIVERGKTVRRIREMVSTQNGPTQHTTLQCHLCTRINLKTTWEYLFNRTHQSLRCARTLAAAAAFFVLTDIRGNTWTSRKENCCVKSFYIHRDDDAYCEFGQKRIFKCDYYTNQNWNSDMTFGQRIS